MARIPYPNPRRFFVVFGCYLLSVIVASFVTTVIFSPSKAAPFVFMMGTLFVLIFASAPAALFIIIVEIVGHPHAWVYVVAGAGVALLANGLFYWAEPIPFKNIKPLHLIAASMVGGAAGAFTFWRLAVAPLKRQTLPKGLSEVF